MSKQLIEPSMSDKKSNGHAINVAYDPHIDDFQYSCLCANDSIEREYTVTKEIHFATDKNGEVILLDIKQLHDGAKLKGDGNVQ